MNGAVKGVAVAIALLLSGNALAREVAPADEGVPQRETPGIAAPAILTPEQGASYRAILTAIRAERWTDAQLLIDGMTPGVLHPVMRAELYTARNSPKVEMPALLALLNEAPELPQAEQIARLAVSRGATALPNLPAQQRLVWYDAPPSRQRARALSDAASAQLAEAMKPFIKADDGVSARALLDQHRGRLTPEALTEWQQKIAWIFYAAGDDENAASIATEASRGVGPWQVQGDWVLGLASWRREDCRTAQAAFERVGRNAPDVEMRSAGLFWATRADIACGEPQRVQSRLQSAAQYRETFYGLLARQSLGLTDNTANAKVLGALPLGDLERRANVRVAAALVQIGELKLADAVLRHQAKIGPRNEHAALITLAGALDLPQTQLWLCHNGPAGVNLVAQARYPAPKWKPEGGWRVDKALVYAHTLQESRFNPDVVSPAGAFGLMQVMPAAAIDVGRTKGMKIERADLAQPSVNMEVGQTYLEQLRDRPFTAGLLPKVIAAYNAGPTPVETWNVTVRSKGDPLLYIESIPYWETRGYVMTVLRNYWMYEQHEGRASASRQALSQGMWPRFPGMAGAPAVRMTDTSAGRIVGAN
ncbi:lytic transglycosylase domain-containing protein [Sphingomonas sp. BGYR3]|uniref:lytic transglycosylase domain-containing protein n=1 Tax=Sphingomonas sp. BGYR3 TaxID=2975483 RepID=UPI0021A91283|nr:lytic transglycosylase domain-containing protein [Sphingomonas sp. BGYR3]MDG5487350.1 lytic transglycosylase domain-containing protein [Sphingomonas sp. BGYR3]